MNVTGKNISSSIETAKSCANNTETVINQLTINESGIYLLLAQASFVKNGTGFRMLRIRNNALSMSYGGFNYTQNTSSSVELQVVSISSPSVNKGNVVKLVARQNSGASLNISHSYITAVRIK